MKQDVGYMFDRHLDYELREHEESLERVWLHNCDDCVGALYEGEKVYYLDGSYYCEDCMDKHKLTL